MNLLVVLTVFIYNLFQHLVYAGGAFELEIVKFSNPQGKLADGTCCGSTNDVPSTCPSSSCQTFSRICLQSYSQDLRHLNSNSCPYGSLDTDIFQNSASILQGTIHYSIAFNFSWPGSTTLVLELHHLSNPASNDHQLISRTVRPIELNATDNWMLYEEKYNSIRFGYRVRIVCEQFFYGPACNIKCEPNDDHTFNKGHYNCSEVGTKICHVGWQGAKCDQPICKSGCGGESQGKCIEPNMCECRYGWNGDNCEQCIPYEGCEHGFCNKPFECICEQRWGGLQCEKDLDYCLHHQPCKFGSTCIPHAPDNYTCVCDSKHSGRDCQIQTSPCWSNPCLNFGTCVVVDDDYKCICDQFHSGTNCQNDSRLSGEVELTTENNIQTQTRNVVEGQPCFYQGIYHPHLTRWETKDCRICNCIEGQSNCSRVGCQPDNCLLYDHDKFDINGPSRLEMFPTAIRNPRCPSDQVCRPVTMPQCLKRPCLETFGQCVPWPLIDQTNRKERCRENLNLGLYDSRCSRFYMAMKEEKLPAGTTVENVCYDLLLVILTQQVEHYGTDCHLKTIHPLIIEVNLISARKGWETDQLRDILMAKLKQNLTMSRILQSVYRVSTTLVGIQSKKQLYEIEEKTNNPTTTQELSFSDQPASYGPVIVSVLLALLALICVLLVVICILRHRLQDDKQPSPNEVSLTSEQGNAISVQHLQSKSDSVRWNNLRPSPICLKSKKLSDFSSSNVGKSGKMCNLWRGGDQNDQSMPSDQQAWYLNPELKSSTLVNDDGKVATIKPLRTLEHLDCSQDKDNDIWVQESIKSESGELVAQIEASV